MEVPGMPENGSETVVEATDRAIRAASHLTAADAGAVEALRRLAAMVDNPPAKVDTVSLPTYLRFCESLGLTPAGRKRLDEKREQAGGKLGQLRAVPSSGKRASGRRPAG